MGEGRGHGHVLNPSSVDDLEDVLLALTVEK